MEKIHILGNERFGQASFVLDLVIIPWPIVKPAVRIHPGVNIQQIDQKVVIVRARGYSCKTVRSTRAHVVKLKSKRARRRWLEL